MMAAQLEVQGAETIIKAILLEKNCVLSRKTSKKRALYIQRQNQLRVNPNSPKSKKILKTQVS